MSSKIGGKEKAPSLLTMGLWIYDFGLMIDREGTLVRWLLDVPEQLSSS